MKHSHISAQSRLTTYDLSPRKVTTFLLSIIALLIFFNFVERGIIYWLNAKNDSQLISVYFNFDREGSLASFYSASVLGFCSYLLTVVATFKKAATKYAKHWKALSYIFLYLAIDEASSIHELLIPPLRRVVNVGGLLYYPWVIPAFFSIIVFLIIFRKFIFALPSNTRKLFILAGTIYVAGALGTELVGGYIADNYGYNTVYGVASTTEELLEMFGVVIFVYGLLSYIQSKTSELNFSLSFQQSNKKTIRF